MVERAEVIGLQLIINEAQHQRQEYGFEHDVETHGSERLMLAAGILLYGTDIPRDDSSTPWAIDLWEKHRESPQRRAMIAGALCASALDVMAFEIGRAAMKKERAKL